MKSGTVAVSALSFEEALLLCLESHIESEQEVLEGYAALAADGPDHVRYLVELIVDDEQRHHRIMQEMANRILSEVEFERVEPSVPYEWCPPRDRDRLVEQTNRFLEQERSDLSELKVLERAMRRQHRDGLFPLLVRTMELDTYKHVAILEFLRKTAK